MSRANDVEFKEQFEKKSKRAIYDEVVRQRNRYAGMKSAYSKLLNKKEKMKNGYVQYISRLMRASADISRKEQQSAKRNGMMDGLFYGMISGGVLTVMVVTLMMYVG